MRARRLVVLILIVIPIVAVSSLSVFLVCNFLVAFPPIPQFTMRFIYREDYEAIRQRYNLFCKAERAGDMVTAYRLTSPGYQSDHDMRQFAGGYSSMFREEWAANCPVDTIDWVYLDPGGSSGRIWTSQRNYLDFSGCDHGASAHVVKVNGIWYFDSFYYSFSDPTEWPNVCN